MNNNYQQLIISDEGSITVEEKRFVELHKEIMYCGNTAAELAIKMMASLKEMRDTKIYAAAGFKTFSDYVEIAVGIQERQAYNYIKVYEDLPESFLHSNAKIGITKLSLLASIPSVEREQIIENNDIENISVRELKEQIKQLEKQNEQLQLDIEEMPDKLGIVDLESDLKRAEDKLKAAEKESAGNASKAAKLIDEKAKLEKEIEQLKKAPKAVATIPDPKTEAQLTQVKKDLEKAQAELNAKSKKPEVDQKTAAQLEQAQKELEVKQAELTAKNLEIEKLNKQILIAGDAAMSEFKVKFNDFQRLGLEILALLEKLDEDKKAKCKSGLRTVWEGWKL